MSIFLCQLLLKGGSKEGEDKMKRCKVLLSFLMCLLLTFTCFLPAFANGGGAQGEITVTVRMELEDSTITPPTKVTLPKTYKSLSDYGVSAGVTEPGYYTAAHVLAQYAADELGADKDHMSDVLGFSYGNLSEFGGDSIPGSFWMFMVNDSMPVGDNGYGANMDQYKLKDGDSVVLYSVSGWDGYLYSYFEQQSYTVEAGQPVEVTLLGKDIMAVSDPVPVQGASLITSGDNESAATDTNIKTDSRGRAQITFDSPGTYTLSAKRSGNISRANAVVKVTASDADKDRDYVAADKRELTLPAETSDDLTLPAVGKSKMTSVSWTSSDPAVIGLDGTVTRADEDKTVKLKAAIKKGAASDIKEFDVKVLKNEKASGLKSIDFSIGGVEFAADRTDYQVNLPAGVKQVSFRFTHLNAGAAVKVEGARKANSRAADTYVADVPGTVKITSTYNGASTTYTFRFGEIKSVSSQWPSFRGNTDNNGVVPYRTARNSKEASLKWKYKAAAYGPSDLLLVNGHIYIAGDDELAMLDKNGKEMKSVKLASSLGFFTRLAYGEGMIYVPIGNGQIQAFTADSLQPVWTSGEIADKQTISTLTYSDGYLYTGITKADWSSTSDGEFLCLNAKTGAREWSHTPASQGYYWSGAAVVGNAVIVGGDDGTLTSLNAKTGSVIDTKNVGAMIRSTVVYDKESGSLFFTTTDGSLHKAEVDRRGRLSGDSKVSFAAYSTSTPAISQGKAFVGGSNADYSGNFSVIDIKKMKVSETVSAPSEVKSAPLVTTGYNGKLYAYATSNTTPGALYYLEFGSGQKELKALYTPESSDQQYCSYSPAADSDGTLYYANDSGYLFALKGPGPLKGAADPSDKDSQEPGNGGSGDESKTDKDKVNLNKTKSGSPSTGDTAAPVYWVIFLMAAGCVIAVRYRRVVK